jgi:hypothetical protein
MKIKCPWFDEPDEMGEKCYKYCRNEKELFNHIVNYPHSGIAKKFAKQTVKIHERLEELEKAESKTHGLARVSGEIEELKSLLEDEK